ncbi:MAG TPA: Asp-tRNA(Asn)/Glu-tRNA(Gln) amidotransferase subunit GatC [bacterium]|jgi:aspartyl-tRNA(Asn)/glutamyl-tRNA(Gln) amidotransferase subunit C|nr:Asp-tRNA(Asn)/Glu-tRNA(Gln) amidotransferase subunit GatC [bacterium]
MALSEKDVDHVARLARLEITHEERGLYQKQLNAILGHAADIAGLDLSAVPPTAHILPLSNVWREDAVHAGLSREEALANAPDRSKGCFRVPKIIE